MSDDIIARIAPEEWERWKLWRRGEYNDQCADALIAALTKAVEERDEALTIAYRLSLQMALPDLREHLEPWSLDVRWLAARDRYEQAEADLTAMTKERDEARSALTVTALAAMEAEKDAVLADLAAAREEATDLLDAVFQTVMPDEGERILWEAFSGEHPEWVQAWLREHPTEDEAARAAFAERYQTADETRHCTICGVQTDGPGAFPHKHEPADEGGE